MINVHKLVPILLFISFLCMQACQRPQDNSEAQAVKKTDLSRAASYNVQLGLGYLKQGDRPRAKKKLLTAHQQEPNSSEVNAAMAYYFEQTKELAQAEKYYMKALALSSNSGAQLNNYGTFLCRQGQYQKAETYFLKATADEQYINTAGAFENAALCALAIPDKEKAKVYFGKAFNQDPSRRTSLYELVKLESSMGHDNEAYELIEKHPDLVLNDKIFLVLAKKIATKAGKNDIALAYDNSLKGLEHNIDNSGVNNEYNNHTG